MPLLFLLACLPDLRETDHDRPGEGAIALDSVTPGYAHTGGGTELTLVGGPFDASAVVEIDGVRAQVLRVEEDRIVVESPALPDSGWSDIAVETDLGWSALEDGLRVFEEARGLAGTFGAIEWYELQGDYWTEDSEDWGVAWWGLIEPEDVHYWDLFDVEEVDSCVSSPTFPTLRVMDLGVEETELVTAAARVALPASEDRFFDAPLYSFEERSSWSVPSIEGGELPAFGIEEVARTPGAFDLYAPYLFGGAPPVLTKSELRLEWGEVEADQIMIMVKRFDQDLGEPVEVLGCVVENDGAFHVKGVNWQEPWEKDQWLYIYVGAVLEGEGEVPLNGADSRVAGVYWLVGAAVTAK